MQPLYRRALGAGLVAIGALLVGFQGATTVLTIAEYGASAKRSESKPGETRLANLQTERRAVEAVQPVRPEPVPAEPQAAAPEEQPVASTGIAAAAKAKALAEIEAMEERAQPSAPPPRVKRTYRAPRVDKHRIY